MAAQVIKSSGKKEHFSQQKLRRSLHRAGVPEDLTKEIVDAVSVSQKDQTTESLHKKVYSQLLKKERPLAAKYNLKRALVDLGPSGYPFEQFVGRLFVAKGYKTSTNRIIRGRCVSHEIDVMAQKGNNHDVIECKFHNRAGYKSDVQTVLYMKARFDDIREYWESLAGDKENKHNHLHRVWIVTNTSFTSEAIKYGRCNNMGLMSWRAPAGNSLAEMIEETGLHPITALTSLSKKQKEYVVSHDLVLCREARKKKDVLIRAGVRGAKIERVLKEAQAICNI